MSKKKKNKKFKYKNHEKKAQQESHHYITPETKREESFDSVENVQLTENKNLELSYEERKALKQAKKLNDVKSHRGNKQPFIVFGIVILLVILGFIFLGGKKDSSDNSREDSQESAIDEEMSGFIPEAGAKEIVVLSNFENTVRNGKQTDAAKIALTRTGEIETAQILVLASSNDKALDPYSSAYVKLTTPDAPRGTGGHLHQNDSIITSDSVDQSLFVYEMSSVAFRPLGSSKELATANWLETMNTYNDFKIYAFTSTIGEGEIEQILITYTCVEGSDCNIALAE